VLLLLLPLLKGDDANGVDAERTPLLLLLPAVAAKKGDIGVDGVEAAPLLAALFLLLVVTIRLLEPHALSHMKETKPTRTPK